MVAVTDPDGTAPAPDPSASEPADAPTS
jgi:hypothetical protein